MYGLNCCALRLLSWLRFDKIDVIQSNFFSLFIDRKKRIVESIFLAKNSVVNGYPPYRCSSGSSSSSSSSSSRSFVLYNNTMRFTSLITMVSLQKRVYVSSPNLCMKL